MSNRVFSPSAPDNEIAGAKRAVELFTARHHLTSEQWLSQVGIIVNGLRKRAIDQRDTSLGEFANGFEIIGMILPRIK